MADYGTQLKDFFRANRLRNNEVAELIGVSKQTVSTDLHTPDLTDKQLEKYTKHFGFSLDEFKQGRIVKVAESKAMLPESVDKVDETIKLKDKLISLLEQVNIDLRKRLADAEQRLAEKERELSFV